MRFRHEEDVFPVNEIGTKMARIAECTEQSSPVISPVMNCDDQAGEQLQLRSFLS